MLSHRATAEVSATPGEGSGRTVTSDIDFLEKLEVFTESVFKLVLPHCCFVMRRSPSLWHCVYCVAIANLGGIINSQVFRWVR